jgi:hypothetical protein
LWSRAPFSGCIFQGFNLFRTHCNILHCQSVLIPHTRESATPAETRSTKQVDPRPE